MLKGIDLQLFASPANIILGDGVFSIGGVALAATRGGGVFSIEREHREIMADGDYGPVKGRIRLIKSVAKLKVNALEILPASIPSFYPAMSEDSTSSTGTSTITGMDGTIEDIQVGDYQSTVTWTGKTKAGKAVTITVKQAINLENIEWPLIDKEEVIAETNRILKGI